MSNEELVKEIQLGRQELSQELWLQVEKFVHMQADKFWRIKWQDRCKKMCVELDDLYQVGYFALLDAINKYKLDTGANFLTFFNYDLKHWFMKTIKMTMHAGTWCGSADALERAKSIDAKVYSDNDDIELGETIPDRNAEQAFANIEAQIDQAIDRQALEAVISQLTIREAQIIRNYYFNQEPLAKQAKALGLSRTRTDVIRRAALEKLRRSKKLAAYRERKLCKLTSAKASSISRWREKGSQQEQYVIALDEYEHYLANSSDYEQTDRL